MNSDNPGTGSYAATIVGTNNPAPRFVRNFDGPVVAYKFAGGTDNDITAVAQQGGTLGGGIITFTTTDTVFDGFGQSQAKIWTTNPGSDIKVAGANPYNVADDVGSTGGWRSLNDATGTIDVSAIPAGSLHIYYGAFGAKPTVSVVMRDTDTGAPDITIADAHLNGDTANRTEYYLAEIDFVTDGIYDKIEFVWNSGNGNGRGLAVVVTEAVADAVAPTLDPANIVANNGGPITSVTPLAYTVTYSELIDPASITTDDFELVGTATGTVTSVVHFGGVTTVNILPTSGTSGTIQLQVKAAAVITDLAGNALDTTVAITDPDTVTIEDLAVPTVASIKGPSVSGTIYGTPTITYTVTFSEFINPVTASNFTNVGTAPFTIGAVTQVSPGAPSPSVYTVEVIPSGAGTVQLEVQGTVQDPSANALAVPVTDTMVYTLNTGAEPARETVTLDGSTTSNLTTPTHELVFDASASDKLVVIVTGENGNPGSLAGNVVSLTYDGIPLTQAVDRAPIGSAPSAAFDQTYNDIWYLDGPAAATALADANDSDLATTGNIKAVVDSRGVITAVRLSGTVPGVGATEISGQEKKIVSVLAATSGGLVLASHGMGGDGNSANTQSVNTVPMEAELSAVKQGSDWNGHVTSQTSVASPGFVTATFTGGNTIGTHTIAAEFVGALVSGGGSPYDTWAAINAPTTGNNPSADEDGDGVSNGVEFVLGGTISTNDLGKLPAVSTSGGNMTFTFLRAQSSIDPKTGLSIEVSTDLAAWNIPPSPYTVPDGAVANNPGVTVVKDTSPGFDTVTLTVPQTSDSKKFARLQVVITP